MIIRSNSSGPIYTLRLPTCAPATHTLTTVTSASTWHRRLGHPDRDVISRLSSTVAIYYLKLNLDSLCHACQLGHHTRPPFYTSSSHANKPFDLIHCDLWTSHVLSASGYKYYLVVLDDFSHYLWTFPLRLKSDTFTTLSKNSPMRPHSSAAPSRTSKVITTASLTTCPLSIFFSLMVPS
jgi:hypothetical protein